jgi:hypothetical protein
LHYLPAIVQNAMLALRLRVDDAAMKRRWFRLAVLVLLAAAAYGAWRLCQPILRPTPEEALRSFYDHEGRFEDQLCDPLILAGRNAVPLVMEEIGRGDRPLRRAAICFLGNAGDDKAIPLLFSILESDSELEGYRGYALIALYQLHSQDGLLLAGVYADRRDFLGYVAREMLEKPSRAVPQRRTYLDALVGAHYM